MVQDTITLFGIYVIYALLEMLFTEIEEATENNLKREIIAETENLETTRATGTTPEKGTNAHMTGIVITVVRDIPATTLITIVKRNKTTRPTEFSRTSGSRRKNSCRKVATVTGSERLRSRTVNPETVKNLTPTTSHPTTLTLTPFHPEKSPAFP